MYVFSPLLFYTLQVVGLLPFSVNYLPLRGDVGQYSKSRVLYSALMAISVCVIFLGWIWESFYSEVASDANFWSNLYTTTAVIMAVCSKLTTFLGSFVCLFVAAIRSPQKILLLEKLAEIDFLLQKKPSSNNTMVVSYIIIIYTFALTLTELIINEFPTFDAGTLVMHVVVMCGLLEVMELVLSVKKRFQLVNEKIVEVVSRSRSRSKEVLWTVALPYVETFNVPPETITVPDLNQIHWNLCCVTYDINSIYGHQLAATLVYVFCHLIFGPYILLLVLSSCKLGIIALLFCWVLYYIAELHMLVVPCSLAVDEAKRTVVIVTRMMGSKMEKSFFEELETFAHQLFQRDVQFSASGLFTLQTSIITSVASAVTTYMAIIIQFQNADKKTTSSSGSTTSSSLLTK